MLISGNQCGAGEWVTENVHWWNCLLPFIYQIGCTQPDACIANGKKKKQKGKCGHSLQWSFVRWMHQLKFAHSLLISSSLDDTCHESASRIAIDKDCICACVCTDEWQVTTWCCDHADHPELLLSQLNSQSVSLGQKCPRSAAGDIDCCWFLPYTHLLQSFSQTVLFRHLKHLHFS